MFNKNDFYEKKINKKTYVIKRLVGVNLFRGQVDKSVCLELICLKYGQPNRKVAWASDSTG